MSIASLGASASSALSHALGHHHAHKPQQAGSMADLLAQLTGGTPDAAATAGGGGSAVGKIGQDLLAMLGGDHDQATGSAKASAAYGAGTQLGTNN